MGRNVGEQDLYRQEGGWLKVGVRVVGQDKYGGCCYGVLVVDCPEVVDEHRVAVFADRGL